MSDIKTLYFKDWTLYLLDQRNLPLKIDYVKCDTVEMVAEAIKNMVVRGAPAIGVTAAYGLVIAAKTFMKNDYKQFIEKMNYAKELLSNTRPTAINLFWALNQMEKLYINDNSFDNIADILLKEAQAIEREDIELNKKIGEFGASLIKDGDGILTHCNAGALATSGWGTALGVIRSAYYGGKRIHVYIDETRPYLQGARITSVEMLDLGVDCTLICDNMAGFLMRQGKINAVIVGADRIAANGDTANKIGTYSLAVLANYHNIPFYVVAPYSTLDMDIKSGKDIPIEMRNKNEVLYCGKHQIAPKNINVYNPAFDITPSELISAIITERGVFKQPYSETLSIYD